MNKIGMKFPHTKLIDRKTFYNQRRLSNSFVALELFVRFLNLSTKRHIIFCMRILHELSVLGMSNR